ncbi:D-alanyl-D-alanine carboxypeptidase [Butyricicoccus pullicaecorum DSM 23266]|uniref:serine-type D-Ala-D-Ala carboxypeptidase n=2 Tax=Butyricicoccus pullicaecorum TaxID=501571 RepID=R8W9T5_9FIRM|nr:hypothetical protein HMPREF1526_00048 [Butyricicoccus pullicaecorum 1.2]SKA62472.1 D-alanyl-D-alanine carboxypeptidase [Butyricicoccus pullicaecorum DSM 23266]
MRRWRTRVLMCLFLVLLCGRAGAMSAQSAVVIDADTGEVRYEHNADAVMPMASTTKIMTAIVAIEQGDIDRTYTVKPEYTQTEGSSMYLKPGETVSIRDTLYGLMLMSGNDAALAIAGECGGQEAFVQAMNDKAETLGLTNTHFENPNGLDRETHHTTARELAELTAYALQNPDFREIVSTKNITCAGRTMVNHNKMLSLYKGAIGVKTGYTKKCGRCLVSAAERNGRTLIAVTLNDPDDWNDHCTMLDEAFAQYTPVTLHEAGDTVGEVTVEGGTAQSVPLIAGHEVTAYLAPGEQVTDSLRGRPFVYATVAGGDYYGEIVYQIGEHILKTDTLSYAYDVEQLPSRKGILERCLDFVRGLFD